METGLYTRQVITVQLVSWLLKYLAQTATESRLLFLNSTDLKTFARSLNPSCHLASTSTRQKRSHYA